MTEKEYYIILGKKFRALRESQNVTQDDLAKQTGYDRTIISRFENNGKKITTFRLEQLLGAMGLALADLGSEYPPEKKNSIDITVSLPASNGLTWSDFKRKLLNALQEGADEISRNNAEADRAFLDELDDAARKRDANEAAARNQQPISCHK